MKEIFLAWICIALPLSLLLTLIVVFLTSKSEKSGKSGIETVVLPSLLLRTIRASWILWLLTFLFTVIISPYMFFMYNIPYLIIAVSIFFAVISVVIGSKLSKYFIAGIYRKYRLKKRTSGLLYSSLMLFFIILLMDIASVAEESYVDMISQYLVYAVSVTLLLIVTILLTLPLIISLRKGKTEVVERNV